ncbi:hypothetical protein ABPG74_011411 [Tetrahymena malaccensis]
MFKFNLQSERKRIGILGGTFDPPTISHIDIAKESLLQQVVDEVWVGFIYQNQTEDQLIFIFIQIVPCGLRTDKQTQTEPKHRLEMVKIAAQELIEQNKSLEGKLITNDIEVKNNRTIPTYPLMKRFEKEYPEFDFYFLMGYDLIKGLLSWDEGQSLVEEIKFIIAGQPNLEWKQFDDYFPKNYKLIKIYQNVRSTNYRKTIVDSYKQNNNTFAADLGLEAGLLSQNIINYIIQNNLYVQQN